MDFIILNATDINFLKTLRQNIIDTSPLEFIAVIFGITSVLFAKRTNILTYPTGIVSVSIYIYILMQPDVQLYADAGINMFYFIMSIYGWIQWSKKNEEKATKQISTSSKRELIASVIGIIIAIPIIIMLLKIFKAGNADYWADNIPYIDAFTTSMAIVGMLLMAYKKIENWIFWIIVDAISIPLYIYKGLFFTSIQFLTFCILAIMGYLEWKRNLEKNIKITAKNN